jgi:hypothetical protein
MQEFIDPELLNLNDCECCEGIDFQTPVLVQNRPGLSALAYRVGSHAQFKSSLLASLSNPKLATSRQLTTRNNDDFAIALLDAWATVADVLTFYQERIANESYLRTATEPFSIRHLARLIGYELRPGVAASTLLAFTIEDTPGSPQRVLVDVGTKVQSIPAAGEQAQTFETIEKIEARAEWNAIRPRLKQSIELDKPITIIRLRGINLNLKVGDWILIGKLNNSCVLQRIEKVDLDTAAQETIVNMGEETDCVVPSISPKGAYVFRATASLFGYNAPKQILYTTDGKPKIDPTSEQVTPKEWKPELVDAGNNLYLDNAYNEIIKGSFVAVLKSGTSEPEIYKVQSIATSPRTEYSISSKTTHLTLDRLWWNLSAPTDKDFKVIRETSVYIHSEPLELTNSSIKTPIEGNTIELNGHHPELQVGQQLVLIGETQDKQRQQEVITLSIEPAPIEDYTKIKLQQNLQHTYQRDTVTINANVARATHGETVQEVLGSGDASQAFQQFTLRQPPLTFTSASTPNGTASTLQIRVNNVLWHEVPTLDGRGALERVYITRQNEGGQTTVIFGDGKTGARLPTGQDNVHAIYRKGIGQAGNVKADQLTMLLSRPLGLRGVTNSLPATGGDDPESLDRARQNAPLTVLTLDRIVSLKDYEDFTRAFAGIAKALATWTWNGQKRGVFLTIAGVKGTAVTPGEPLHNNLLAAIRKVSDRHVPIQIATYRPAFFHLRARVKLDADFDRDQVLNRVRQALQTQFSFQMRAFGQGIALSEVYVVMQAIPGVMAIDIDQFHRFDEPTNFPQPQLVAAVPYSGSQGEILAAELLMLDSHHPPQLEVML